MIKLPLHFKLRHYRLLAKLAALFLGVIGILGPVYFFAYYSGWSFWIYVVTAVTLLCIGTVPIPKSRKTVYFEAHRVLALIGMSGAVVAGSVDITRSNPPIFSILTIIAIVMFWYGQRVESTPSIPPKV